MTHITNPARFEVDVAADEREALDLADEIRITQRARALLQPGCREFCFVEEAIYSSDDAEKYQDAILRIASSDRSVLELEMDRAELRLILESHATAYAQSGHVDSAYTPQLDSARAEAYRLHMLLEASISPDQQTATIWGKEVARLKAKRLSDTARKGVAA